MLFCSGNELTKFAFLHYIRCIKYTLLNVYVRLYFRPQNMWGSLVEADVCEEALVHA